MPIFIKQVMFHSAILLYEELTVLLRFMVAHWLCKTHAPPLSEIGIGAIYLLFKIKKLISGGVRSTN
jgi:hypothetical protein